MRAFIERARLDRLGPAVARGVRALLVGLHRHRFAVVATTIVLVVVGGTAEPYIQWGHRFDPARFWDFTAEASTRLFPVLLVWLLLMVLRAMHRHAALSYDRRVAREAHWRALAREVARLRNPTWRSIQRLPFRERPQAIRGGPTVPLGDDASSPADTRSAASSHVSRAASQAPPPEGRDASPSDLVMRPPVLKRFTLDSLVTAPGIPIHVAWSFHGADTVTVDGRAGLPATGSIDVFPDVSRQIEITGESPLGRVTAYSDVVAVLPLPEVGTVRLPRPPTVRLSVDVAASLTAGSSTVAALDDLLSRQDAARRPHGPQLAPLLVPRPLVEWTRQHRHQLTGWAAALTAARDEPPLPPRTRSAHRPQGSPHR